MTIERAPLSFPNATKRVAAVIGYAAMARIVKRSERLIRKWSHPSARAHPTIAQALAMDAAFAAAGGAGSPYLETYAQLLDAEIGRQIADRIALTNEIASAAQESGEAIAHALGVAQPDSSPRAIHRALGAVEEACSAMAVVGRRLSSFLPRGAGPREENRGGITQ